MLLDSRANCVVTVVPAIDVLITSPLTYYKRSINTYDMHDTSHKRSNDDMMIIVHVQLMKSL